MTQTEKIILQQSERHDCLYIYDEAAILKSAQALKDAFPNVGFLYSIKANSHPEVVKTLINFGFGVDAASREEVLAGTNNGLSKQQIYYSAPGKTRRDIEVSIERGTIIADSINEIELINTIAKELGIKPKIGVRINPDFSFDGDEGVPSKFGVDESELFANMDRITSLSHARLVGLHVHVKSQELDAEKLIGYYTKMFSLSKRVAGGLKESLEFINMGGGLGVAYTKKDAVLDVKRVGEALSQLKKQYGDELAGAKVFIETGRYTTCNAGVYAVRVLDKKVSNGRIYIILANTLNGFMRPALQAMMAHYAPDAQTPYEPLFTQRDAFGINVLSSAQQTEKVTLCGNLCTSADIIATDIVLPKMQVGDVVTIDSAGAYGAVLSPMQFASLTPPVQLFLTKSGVVR